MIVVDTNIIGYLFLKSKRSGLAEQALRQDSEWGAPLLWRSELRNVLALYVRRGLLALSEAQEMMDTAMDLVRGREYDVVSSHVLKLAADSSCSAYDCEFVAVAQDLGVPLVTVDKQVLKQFPKIATSLEDFCSSG